MRILYVGPSTERVPPYRYGSVGRIVDQLVQGCFEHGQEIDLIASGDSRTKARRLIPAADAPVKRVESVLERVAELVHRLAPQYDLVHNHESVLAPYLEPVRGSEVMTTCHLEQQDVWTGISRQWLVPISADQAQRIGGTRITDPIPPCVNTAEFGVPRGEDGGYLLVLSKMSQKKGIMDAISIARASGRKLVLAGPVFPKDQSFYLRSIAPEIDGSQIVYFGEAVEHERRALLRHASALLFPNLYGEPFGMVLLEALASGVPVIASGSNAAPEVIEHGRTGFLASGVGEAVEAVERLADIDPVACRLRAEHFNYHAVSALYLRAYRRLLGNSSEAPTTRPLVFLLRGKVSSEARSELTGAMRAASAGALASLALEPGASSESVVQLASTGSRDASVVLIWAGDSTPERLPDDLSRRYNIADITLVDGAARSPETAIGKQEGEFRARTPSTMLSSDVPAPTLARQLLAHGGLRFDGRNPEKGAGSS
ncbi:glycosyltransferase [Saccharopolyspora taberi]|uniref:Glycosyl transferase family 1 domain-containing protein n=1 Tax=Saccharopolyspora taberi TaxID=60895 RepID=A0ABN3VEZ0_9PSEU